MFLTVDSHYVTAELLETDNWQLLLAGTDTAKDTLQVQYNSVEWKMKSNKMFFSFYNGT